MLYCGLKDHLSVALKKKILVIEDEFLMVQLLEGMLQDLGYESAGRAFNKNDAEDDIHSCSFDAAILDINLNGIKAYELADQLKTLNIPFVFSTAYARQSIPQAYQNVPVLQKPYTNDALKLVLESVCPLNIKNKKSSLV
jgi:CheY-like chemotaxis protein